MRHAFAFAFILTVGSSSLALGGCAYPSATIDEGDRPNSPPPQIPQLPSPPPPPSPTPQPTDNLPDQTLDPATPDTTAPNLPPRDMQPPSVRPVEVKLPRQHAAVASGAAAPAYSQFGSEYSGSVVFASLDATEARFITLERRSAWQTGQGTITSEGLRDLLAACEALGLHPRECASSILAGDRPFGVLDPKIRREGNLLFRSCEVSDTISQCREQIESKRFIRDLNIGRVKPSPLEMKQNQPTTFTAFIERTSAVVVPGQDKLTTGGNSDTEGGADGVSEGNESGSLVAYTRETCFKLAAGKDFKIEGENPQCPPLTSGRIAFAPKWTVTPLKGAEYRELRLTRILKQGGKVIEEAEVEPYPIKIKVELEATLAQKVRAWLTDWTPVAEEAKDFVLALEALLAAIAALSIWKLLKRRRRSDSGEQPPDQPEDEQVQGT